VAGDDEEMQRFVPIEDLFKGRHFDRQIIVLCVSWYTSFKHSDSAGLALPSQVREVLSEKRIKS
jgi:transposase-like protein